MIMLGTARTEEIDGVQVNTQLARLARFPCYCSSRRRRDDVLAAGRFRGLQNRTDQRIQRVVPVHDQPGLTGPGRRKRDLAANHREKRNGQTLFFRRTRSTSSPRRTIGYSTAVARAGWVFEKS